MTPDSFRTKTNKTAGPALRDIMTRIAQSAAARLMSSVLPQQAFRFCILVRDIA